MSVWLSHAVLIPILLESGLGPFAFPYPSSLVSTPKPITSVDSGLGEPNLPIDSPIFELWMGL